MHIKGFSRFEELDEVKEELNLETDRSPSRGTKGAHLDQVMESIPDFTI